MRPIAFIVGFVIACSVTWRSAHAQLKVESQPDRLVIMRTDTVAMHYVFNDPQILRPYFSHLRSPSGIQLTRNHPPIEGQDAIDHPTMHPGLWLAFGDINGQDFWRNKAKMKHVEFTSPPIIEGSRIAFATRSRLISADEQDMGGVEHRYMILEASGDIVVVWQATFVADKASIVLGDQEEMGLGVRMATPLTEKKGGRITNSTGAQSAKATWGQSAQWCDYSGNLEQRPVGITLVAAETNFRTPWWHNRDYGLMVANPFGRASMKQGETSRITVEAGKKLSIGFAAILHDRTDYSPAQATQVAVQLLR